MSRSSDDSSKGRPIERRPYEPPRVARIDLEAEQVLAAGCKTASGGDSALPPGCALGGCGGIGS